MIIRAAVVDSNKKRAQALKRRLVMFSLKSTDHGNDIDVDVAECKKYDELINTYCNIDIAFISYDILRENIERLDELYKKNTSCIPIPVGSPDEEICQYLALRPAGLLQSVDEQLTIKKFCEKCAQFVAEDNSILQITTRQGCYAVSTASILYCMSDQKYVSIITNRGLTYRKLAKLDDFGAVLPVCFLRVHQRFLVNSHYIYGIDKSESNWSLLLNTGDRIPISRVYQKSVDEQFQRLQYSYQK